MFEVFIPLFGIVMFCFFARQFARENQTFTNYRQEKEEAFSKQQRTLQHEQREFSAEEALAPVVAGLVEQAELLGLSYSVQWSLPQVTVTLGERCAVICWHPKKHDAAYHGGYWTIQRLIQCTRQEPKAATLQTQFDNQQIDNLQPNEQQIRNMPETSSETVKEDIFRDLQQLMAALWQHMQQENKNHSA